MRYVLGVWLGWQPQRYQFSWHILTGPTQYENRVIHVRPHDSKDKHGNYRAGYIRQCFWLNKSYLKDVIK